MIKRLAHLQDVKSGSVSNRKPAKIDVKTGKVSKEKYEPVEKSHPAWGRLKGGGLAFGDSALLGLIPDKLYAKEKEDYPITTGAGMVAGFVPGGVGGLAGKIGIKGAKKALEKAPTEQLFKYGEKLTKKFGKTKKARLGADIGTQTAVGGAYGVGTQTGEAISGEGFDAKQAGKEAVVQGVLGAGVGLAGRPLAKGYDMVKKTASKAFTQHAVTSFLSPAGKKIKDVKKMVDYLKPVAKDLKLSPEEIQAVRQVHKIDGMADKEIKTFQEYIHALRHEPEKQLEAYYFAMKQKYPEAKNIGDIYTMSSTGMERAGETMGQISDQVAKVHPWKDRDVLEMHRKMKHKPGDPVPPDKDIMKILDSAEDPLYQAWGKNDVDKIKESYNALLQLHKGDVPPNELKKWVIKIKGLTRPFNELGQQKPVEQVLQLKKIVSDLDDVANKRVGDFIDEAQKYAEKHGTLSELQSVLHNKADWENALKEYRVNKRWNDVSQNVTNPIPGSDLFIARATATGAGIPAMVTGGAALLGRGFYSRGGMIPGDKRALKSWGQSESILRGDIPSQKVPTQKRLAVPLGAIPSREE